MRGSSVDPKEYNDVGFLLVVGVGLFIVEKTVLLLLLF